MPGIDPSTNDLLISPVAEDTFAGKLLEAMPRRGPEIAAISAARSTGTRFRRIIERRPTRDLGDARVAGWTYLIAGDDPQREMIIEILRPLAAQRGMKETARPLAFNGEPADEWLDWMIDHYWTLTPEPPHYILIVGGPDRVPFHFQAVLGSVAAVGRLAFDALADLQAYVEKVLRLERERAAKVRRQALLFATDRGRPDPTYYSRRFMADPIAMHVEAQEVPTIILEAEHATAQALLSELTQSHPGIVYTASHGAGLPHATADIQRSLNGAIVCAGDELLSAAEVPDCPVAEGAVMLQFACFSAGTPAQSDYAHWLGDDRLNATADFVAALPSRLLAHPRGPIAFVGHVDLTWIHAFDDPDDPDAGPDGDRAWHPRLAPFISAVDTLLEPQPVGLAMKKMNERYDVGNAHLAVAFDRQKRGTLPDNPEAYGKLVRAFITRSDAQNYLVLGDPAVYLRMEAP